jgi:hypothetical protein
VRVLEARRVLQAVADGAIHADVREPDQCQFQAEIGARDDADDSKRDGKRVEVCEVVDDCTDPQAEEVTGSGVTGACGPRCRFARDLVELEGAVRPMESRESGV